jgi:hypothetical protein
MNPYLENPELWPEVHHILISLLAETLNPKLLPSYRVAIEKRVYQMTGEEALFVGIPDVTVSQSPQRADRDQSVETVATVADRPQSVTLPLPIEVREGYLEVRDVKTQEVITVIEVLSPANKRRGRGRDTYLQKRNQVLGSMTHLVEIDLLRTGEPMPMMGNATASDYRILVSRSDRRPTADLYAFNIPDPIPVFPLPLKSRTHDATTIPEPMIDLDPLLNQVIERSGLAVVLDYRQPPTPPLPPKQATWLVAYLKEQGMN